MIPTVAPTLYPAGESPPAGRRLALDVHAELRRMILHGELAPGEVVLQADLARRLGVSRTPTREAFRLLQEEGLIAAFPDQRARVCAADPIDLDTVYGARILLESLAVGLTVAAATPADDAELVGQLAAMRRHAAVGAQDDWHQAHRQFHGVLTGHVGAQLVRMISSLGEHSERYIRLHQLHERTSWSRADAEHQTLLEAFGARNADLATVLIGRHLARTCLTVIADIAPDREPVHTRRALALVGRALSEQG